MGIISRRAISILCSVALVCTMTPAIAWADSEGDEVCTGVLDYSGDYDYRDALIEDAPADQVVPFAVDGEAVSQKVKNVYDRICEQVQKLNRGAIDISGLNVTKGDLGDAIDLVRCNPELWWIGPGFSYSFIGSDQRVLSVTPTYLYSDQEIADFRQTIDESIQEAQSWIKSGMSEFDKAQVLHDYLVRKCSYAHDYVDRLSVTKETEGEYHRAVTALAGTNRQTVCEGYALAYKWLLKTAGIDALMVSSKSMNHAWNIVRLDGMWYHVDVTWDDPDDDDYVLHNYFLKGDSTFQGQLGHSGYYSPFDAPKDYYVTGRFAIYPDGANDPCENSNKYYPGNITNIVVAEPTCTAAGTVDQIETTACCNKEISRKTVSLPALGHKAGAEIRESEHSATCEQSGSYAAVVKCSVCNAEVSRTTKPIPALGHNIVEAGQTTAATCTDPATKTGICTRCGQESTQTVGKALGHSNVWTTTKAATCTAQGAQKLACTRCGAVAGTRAVSALGHSWGAYVSNKNARIGVDGTKTAACKRCGVKQTVTDRGSALQPPINKVTLSKAKSSKKKTLTITWKKPKGNVTGYQVQTATNNRFSAGLKTTTVSKAKTVKATVKKLKSKKKYYVRVRAYYKMGGGTYYGAWSKVKTAKVK